MFVGVHNARLVMARSAQPHSIAGALDPARILASGNSSARSVSTADGDIYVAGITG